MSIAVPTSRTPATVTESLRRLRRRINRWFLVEGLSRLLLCMLLVIAVDILIDWRFNLDRAQRLAMLVTAAIPLSYIAYRYLLKPWLSRLSDDALCLEVERHNQQLGESLISAIQLSRADGPEVKHVSSAMIDATIQQGVAGANDIVFEEILNRGRFRANGWLLGVCVLALIGGSLSAIVTQPMRTWFQRNILLQDTAWANHTFFEFAGLDDGTLAIPYGSNWPVIVRMIDDKAEMPASLDVDLRVKGGRRTERAERYDQNREFRILLKRVTSPFEIRARAGRSRTEWYPVRIVQRPSTEKLELEVWPPKYSGLGPQKLPAGEGPYYVLKGSSLSVKGISSKPISTATLLVGETAHPMKIDGNQLSLELNASLVLATSYRVELEDREQVWSPTIRTFVPLRSEDGLEFTLKNSPDLAPSVKAQLVGIGSMVLPGARIPYTCTMEDDFGLIASRLRYEWRVDTAGSEVETGVSQLAMPETIIGTKTFMFEDAVNLAELKVPAGSGFAFEMEADDTDDVSGPKTGKSTKFLLRVVTEEELRASLLRREKELRQEFESVLKRQEDVLTESEALRAGLSEQDDVTSDQRKSLMEAQRNEKLLGSSVVSIADRLATIIVETQNNRIEAPGGPIEQRLGTQIIDPMRQLGQQHLPLITQHLDRVRRQLEQHNERNAALDEAIAEQQAAIDTMQEILRFMIKSEGFQEAVNLLHQVQMEQRNVADLTDQEKRDRVERLLKDASK